MRTKFALFMVLFVLVLAASSVIIVKYYGYIFAKEVTGQIIGIERVTQPSAIMTSDPKAIPAAQIFSFAVAIRDASNEIHTASSEDRQWAVVQQGQCAEAKFFPYPPWQFDRAGTYHGARLIRLFDCPPK